MEKELEQGGRGLRKHVEEVHQNNEEQIEPMINGVSSLEPENTLYNAPATENPNSTNEEERVFPNTIKVRVERNVAYKNKEDDGSTEIEIPSTKDIDKFIDYKKDSEGNVTSLKLKSAGVQLVKKNWGKVFGEQYQNVNTGLSPRTLNLMEKSLHSESFTPSPEQDMFITQMKNSMTSRINYAKNFQYLQRIKEMHTGTKYQLIKELDSRVYGDVRIEFVENFASASLRSLDETIYEHVKDVTANEPELTQDEIHSLAGSFEIDITKKMLEDIGNADEAKLKRIRDDGLGRYPQIVLQDKVEDKVGDDALRTYIQENYKRILQEKAEEIAKTAPVQVVITQQQVEKKFLDKVKERFKKVDTKKIRRLVGAAILIGAVGASCYFLYNLEKYAERQAEVPSAQELATQGIQNAYQTQTAIAKTATPYVIYETEAPSTLKATPTPKSYFKETPIPVLPLQPTKTPFPPISPTPPSIKLPMIDKNYPQNNNSKVELPLIMKNYTNPESNSQKTNNSENQIQVKKNPTENTEKYSQERNEQIHKHPKPEENVDYRVVKVRSGDTITDILAQNGMDPYGPALTQVILLNSKLLSKHNDPEAVEKVLEHRDWTVRGESHDSPKQILNISSFIYKATHIIITGANLKIPVLK